MPSVAKKTHPLLHEGLEASWLDFEDLIVQTGALVESLRTDDPVAYFFSQEQIRQASTRPDDGSDGNLLVKGRLALQGAGTRYNTRVQLENIMEICFGDSPELSQTQRYHRVLATYSELLHHHFSVRWEEDKQGCLVQEYRILSLLEFYWFCVTQVLRSPQRICRCQHCWQYFTPKTQKKTAYCDRLDGEGKSCKDLGAQLKRQLSQREDPYLQGFQRLQKRLYERSYRGYANAKEMDIDYPTWIEQASEARADYLQGKIDGETFSDLIGADEKVQPTAPTPLEPWLAFLTGSWDSMVARNMNFDPATYFQDMQVCDLEASNPTWETVSAEQMMREAKQGKISLKEKK